jgi:autotransporter translocation and assembly factor TamB
MRVVRRLAQVLLIVTTLIVGATAAAIIVSQTAWFKNWLRGYIVSQANQFLNGQLTIQRLGGNLFFGVELENVGVTMDGSEVVSVQDLGVDYSVFEFISKGMSIDDIRVNKPRLYLRREGDTWSIARLIKRQEREADREGPTPPIAIADIGITDGSVVIDGPVGTAGLRVPERIDRLDAKLSFAYEPVHYSIEISHVSFRGSEPEIGLNALSGGIAVRDDTLFVDKLALRTEETSLLVDGAVQNYLATPVLNLRVSSDKVSLEELSRIVPAVAGIEVQPQFAVAAEGPLDRLNVEMNVRSSAGEMTARVLTDLLVPDQAAQGTLSVRRLNLGPLVKDKRKRTDLTANAKIDLKAREFSDINSVRGRVSIDAPRVAAMGYTAQNVKGTARIQGRQLTVEARARVYDGQATAAGQVRLPLPGLPLEYDLRGDVRDVDLRRLPASINAPQAETNLNLEYHVRGVEPPAGRPGNFAARPRQVEADLRFAGSRVAGTSITDGSVVSASLRDDNVTFHVDASVADLNLQQIGREFNVPALASDRYEGRLGGRVVADGTIANLSQGVTVDSVDASAKVDLDPSRIGEMAIDWANLDADYRDQFAEVRQLEIVGRDLNVKANGTVALNETGESDFTLHADTPRLEEVGRLANVNLSGIAKVDAAVTGNRRDLQAKGQLIGNGVSYGENGALSLTADFEARIPDLAFDRAALTADSKATFVTIGGQTINELSAHTEYAGKELKFDATARQPERSLAAAGSAALHPEHQEVHLERLALETQGLAWQLAPGSQATVQYGSDIVTVKDVRLVSGDQEIAAEGSFGNAGNSLRFTVTNVDLTNVDRLLLREPQFTGRANASGFLTGTREAPHVDAAFRVDGGGFRQFKYEALTGKVVYSGPTLTLDTRLQQNPTQWLTAKGTLPVALFSRPAPAEDGVPPVPPPSMDVTIDSSPIDLGIVQGFTTALTNVTGTLEAHVRLTGTMDDPRPEGAITVADGALTVPPTGVNYTNLAGRIELQPDRLHIDQLTILDNHQSALTLTGDLSIRERQLGGVQLYVNANDFKVIDNEMGNVRIESSLEINGELRAPNIGGYFGVTTGEVNLDEIVALAGPSAYSTAPTEFVTPTGPEQPPAASSVFDGLRMDVSLYVPNDLVIKSQSLQTPGSPIGLGALNATLGGDLRAMKEAGGRVRLVGAVNTVRGTYDFQGRRFEILRDGAVHFDGTDDLNPRLDLRTRRIIQAVEAFVNIRGTLKEPQIELRSNPPLEQADILALVVFNQPLSQLGEGEQVTLAARAQALAASAVVGQLAQSIGGALNLDTFEIELAPETGTDALVTLGQQVGRNLYLKVQQGVGDQALTNVILEYELMRWLRLQTNVVQGSSTQQSVFRRTQDTGADLVFFFSY